MFVRTQDSHPTEEDSGATHATTNSSDLIVAAFRGETHEADTLPEGSRPPRWDLDDRDPLVRRYAQARGWPRRDPWRGPDRLGGAREVPALPGRTGALDHRPRRFLLGVLRLVQRRSRCFTRLPDDLRSRGLADMARRSGIPSAVRGTVDEQGQGHTCPLGKVDGWQDLGP